MTDARVSPDNTPLLDLENPGEFIARHIGPSDEDIRRMLDVVGAASLDDLADSTVPARIRDAEEEVFGAIGAVVVTAGGGIRVFVNVHTHSSLLARVRSTGLNCRRPATAGEGGASREVQ